MATKYFCDICGKEMISDELTLQIQETAVKEITLSRWFKLGDGSPNQYVHYDMICFDCSKQINMALRLFPYDLSKQKENE